MFARKCYIHPLSLPLYEAQNLGGLGSLDAENMLFKYDKRNHVSPNYKNSKARLSISSERSNRTAGKKMNGIK